MYSGAKRTEVEAFLEPSMKTHTKERGRRNKIEQSKKNIKEQRIEKKRQKGADKRGE